MAMVVIEKQGPSQDDNNKAYVMHNSNRKRIGKKTENI